MKSYFVNPLRSRPRVIIRILSCRDVSLADGRCKPKFANPTSSGNIGYTYAERWNTNLLLHSCRHNASSPGIHGSLSAIAIVRGSSTCSRAQLPQSIPDQTSPTAHELIMDFDMHSDVNSDGCTSSRRSLTLCRIETGHHSISISRYCLQSLYIYYSELELGADCLQSHEELQSFRHWRLLWETLYKFEIGRQCGKLEIHCLLRQGRQMTLLLNW